MTERESLEKQRVSPPILWAAVKRAVRMCYHNDDRRCQNDTSGVNGPILVRRHRPRLRRGTRRRLLAVVGQFAGKSVVRSLRERNFISRSEMTTLN